MYFKRIFGLISLHMSGEAAGEAGVYSLDGTIINDPLQQDPAARAAYSGNFGFTAGAAAVHPIRSAAQSLLARPEIAEALEYLAVEGITTSAPIPAETGDDAFPPVDTTLALDGLAWLRKNLSEAPDLRVDVVDAKGSLTIRQQQETQALREAEKQAEREAEAARRQSQATSSRRADKEALQNESDRLLQEAVAEVQEIYPGISFDNFFKLAAKLAPVREPGGGISTRPRKGYHRMVTNMVRQSLNNPDQLVNDMGLAIILGKRLRAQGKDDEGSHAFAYVDRIGGSIFEAMHTTIYEDPDEATLEAWLSAVAKVDSGFELAEGTAEPVTASGVPVEVAQKVFVHGEILSNSLIAIAQKDPVKFIERIHALAHRSLEGDTDTIPTRFNMTMNVIGKCLDNPLVGCELMRSSYFVEEPEIQRRGIDVLRTLQHIGIPLDEIYPPGSIDKIDQRSRRVLINALVTRGTNGAIDVESLDGVRAKELFEEFEERALSEEGRIDTVFGRLVDYAETTGTSVIPLRQQPLMESLVETLLAAEADGAVRFEIVDLNP